MTSRSSPTPSCSKQQFFPVSPGTSASCSPLQSLHQATTLQMWQQAQARCF